MQSSNVTVGAVSIAVAERICTFTTNSPAAFWAMTAKKIS